MSRKKNLVTTVEEIPLELIYGEYKWGRVYDEYQEMIISNKTNINIVVSVCGRQDNALIEPNTFMMPIREKYLHYPYLFIRRGDADKDIKIEGSVTITIVRTE